MTDSYIGVPPQSGFITTAKQRVTSSTNNYVDLDHAISNLSDVIVWVNFVKQDSTNLSLTTSSRITLGATLVASDIVEIAYLGKAVNTQTPSTGSVSVDMLSASGTKSSSTFLAGDNSFKTVSGTTINNNADNRVITGSGTANTLEGEANLVFDGSRLGVNNSSMSSYDTNGQDLVVGSHSGSNGITVACGSSGSSNIMFATGTSGDQTIKGRIRYNESDNHMGFYTDGDSERLRIDSIGRILANTTSAIDSNAAFSIKELSNYPLATKVDATGNTQQIGFNNGNGHIGGITTNGTATAFNTSSDYRLKENISYDFDATTRLKQLKPARFNFKTDTSKTVDGFLAHEVSSIVPEAITGNKDAVETKQNVVLNANGTMIYNGVLEQDYIDGKANGNYPSDSTWIAEKEVPVYQSIDQAKLVPLLTGALQEAITKIETLEARVKTLEDA